MSAVQFRPSGILLSNTCRHSSHNRRSHRRVCYTDFSAPFLTPSSLHHAGVPSTRPQECRGHRPALACQPRRQAAAPTLLLATHPGRRMPCVTHVVMNCTKISPSFQGLERVDSLLNHPRASTPSSPHITRWSVLPGEPASRQFSERSHMQLVIEPGLHRGTINYA